MLKPFLKSEILVDGYIDTFMDAVGAFFLFKIFFKVP